MKTLLTAASLLLLLGGVSACRHDPARSAPAHRMVQEGALLLDVRSPEEFASGHLPDAVNIPVEELKSRLGELEAKRPIVVYCRSGRRSAKAAELLKSAGFQQVHDLGPMSAW